MENRNSGGSMNNWISNQINWNNLKPKKTCLICNINEDYVCFECEDIFVKENYHNYFYNDDCEWELTKEVA
jgi:hypothetical protein